MMDRLKEFNIRLEMDKLEAIMKSYIQGDVCLYIDDMKYVMHYYGMSKTFQSEIVDYTEIMKQPVLDSKRFKGIQDFLSTFIST